jgi:hypothetical protein
MPPRKRLRTWVDKGAEAKSVLELGESDVKKLRLHLNDGCHRLAADMRRVAQELEALATRAELKPGCLQALAQTQTPLSIEGLTKQSKQHEALCDFLRVLGRHVYFYLHTESSGDGQAGCEVYVRVVTAYKNFVELQYENASKIVVASWKDGLLQVGRRLYDFTPCELLQARGDIVCALRDISDKKRRAVSLLHDLEEYSGQESLYATPRGPAVKFGNDPKVYLSDLLKCKRELASRAFLRALLPTALRNLIQEYCGPDWPEPVAFPD